MKLNVKSTTKKNHPHSPMNEVIIVKDKLIPHLEDCKCLYCFLTLSSKLVRKSVSTIVDTCDLDFIHLYLILSCETNNNQKNHQTHPPTIALMEFMGTLILLLVSILFILALIARKDAEYLC